MEEIVKKANELGLMIKGSEVFSRFEVISKKIEADSEAKSMLEEYAKFSQEYQEKEASGTAIDVEEKQKLQDMNDKLSENELIKEYIATNSYYINMMMLIQKAISEPEGEPIKESKIIKPGSSGKIITDL